MSIMFVNGSPNRGGNTARLASRALGGAGYETLNLVDYKVYPYGQDFDGDRFDEVWARLRVADTIVLGSPVYYYDISSLLKNLIDRSYEHIRTGDLSGKRLAFLLQGAAPAQVTVAAIEYMYERLAAHFDMEPVGFASCAARDIGAAEPLDL